MNIRKGNEPRVDNLRLWKYFLLSGVLVCVFMSVFTVYPKKIFTHFNNKYSEKISKIKYLAR